MSLEEKSMQKIIGLTLGLLSPMVWSQPSTGFLYGLEAVSNSYLQYSCEGSGGRLVCKFTQLMLTPELKEENYEAELQKKLDQATEEANQKGGLDVLHKELCKDIEPVLAVAEAFIDGDVTGLPLEGRDAYYAMSKAERAANKEQFSVFVDICKNKPSNWIEQLSRSELDKSLKTCKLMANNYEWPFEETSTGVYTSRNGPTGACGVVSVSVFTPDPNASFLYNYREQRVVTNKASSIPMITGDLSCSDLDESSLDYQWRTSQEFRNCVYIKLGM